MDKKRICCFFGHRKIAKTEKLKIKLYDVVENLIVNEDINIFLFGSKSQFDDLCLEIVTELKEKYSYIKRIYVRAEFAEISDDYKNYLFQYYDDTYYPAKVVNAGKASYVKRNFEMIDNSSFCVVYYDKNYLPPKRRNSKRDLTDYQPKSGTAIA